MDFLRSIERFLGRIFQPKPRLYEAKWVTDLPDVFDNRTIYLLGESGIAWSIAFVCPCGCGEIIHLNTLNDVRPRWKIRSVNPITLHPSIWRTVGCRSHFFVSKGKIDWVGVSVNRS